MLLDGGKKLAGLPSLGGSAELRREGRPTRAGTATTAAASAGKNERHGGQLADCRREGQYDIHGGLNNPCFPSP